MQREVAEETGWSLGDLKQIGFGHLMHTTPKPENYAYPYPHFIWLIYTGKAIDYDPGRMFSAERLAEEYVLNASFYPIDKIGPKLRKRDQHLIEQFSDQFPN